MQQCDAQCHGGARDRRLVHDPRPKAQELLLVQGLGEEVSVVLESRDVGHAKLERFDHVTNEEVSACDVLGLFVKLRVVREGARSEVVGRDRRGPGGGGGIELGHEAAIIDKVFRRFGESNDFRLARRESNALLPSRAPRDHRVLPADVPAGGGMLGFPRGVRASAKVRRSGVISDAERVGS